MDPNQSNYRLDWRLPIQSTRATYHNEVPQDLRSSISYGADCVFRCGGCSTMYPTIWQLHDHLQLHTQGGSYHYDHHTRTAFPKFDSTCHQTQTDFECNEKAVNFVSSETQTEESLTSNKQEINLKESNVGSIDGTIKLETSEFPHDSENGENIKKEDSDNEKVPVVAPDDPYSGDTDEGSCYLYPESNDDEYENENNSEKAHNMVNNIISNMKSFHSKSVKNSKKEKKQKDMTKKRRLRTNKKDVLRDRKKREKKKDNHVTKKTLLQCKYCNEVFPNSLHVKRHCLQEHPLEKNYQCKYCDEAFVTETEITKHRKVHLREKYQCHICKKSLSSTQNLQDHITMHTGEKMFECKDCGTFFRSRSQLSLHISRRHNPNFDHMCENCGRVFKCRQNLKGHIKICLDIRPFPCEICGKRFPRNTNLNVHMRKHTGEKPFVCHTCGMKFMHSNTLTKHMLVHTGERKFRCDICGMKFKAHNALKDHIRIHNQEKRFTCQYCGKGFIKKCNMVTHIRQHTGETPYKCHICGQGYKQNVLLRTHMQTHKNEPPNIKPESHQQPSSPSSQHPVTGGQPSQSLPALSSNVLSQPTLQPDVSSSIGQVTSQHGMTNALNYSSMGHDLSKSTLAPGSVRQMESVSGHSQLPCEPADGYSNYMMPRM